MSMIYCPTCCNSVDTDYDAEHMDFCPELEDHITRYVKGCVVDPEYGVRVDPQDVFDDFQADDIVDEFATMSEDFSVAVAEAVENWNARLSEGDEDTTLSPEARNPGLK